MKILILFLLLFANIIYAEDFKFGVVPQYDVNILKQRWNPLLHHVSNRTDDKYIFKPAKNMTEFENNLTSGYYDFVYINPSQFLKIHKIFGYKPLLKIKDQYLHGIIVTNNTTELKSLSELNNKEVAFPYPEGFGAYIVVNDYLKKQNINVKPIFVGSHQKVYEAVSSGLYIAGGGITQTLESSNYDIKNKLTIKYTSDAFPPLIIAVHPRVPDDSIQAFSSQLINMNNNDMDKIYLNLIDFEEFELAKMEDFELMRTQLPFINH